ncbi:MAG: hypothetical protein ACP5C3_01190 [Methanomicrobiales archaeon]
MGNYSFLLLDIKPTIRSTTTINNGIIISQFIPPIGLGGNLFANNGHKDSPAIANPVSGVSILGILLLSALTFDKLSSDII